VRSDCGILQLLLRAARRRLLVVVFDGASNRSWRPRDRNVSDRADF